MQIAFFWISLASTSKTIQEKKLRGLSPTGGTPWRHPLSYRILFPPDCPFPVLKSFEKPHFLMLQKRGRNKGDFLSSPLKIFPLNWWCWQLWDVKPEYVTPSLRVKTLLTCLPWRILNVIVFFSIWSNNAFWFVFCFHDQWPDV